MSLLSRNPLNHSAAFRHRRFLNWFPLGLTYATMYMGRYNFNVVKNDIGALYHLDKAQMGLIATFGFWTYGLSVMINGPLADRIGGRKAILIGSLGAGTAQPGRRPDVLQRLDGPRPLEHELALEPEHVLPELRRALRGQGQQHLVPRARARHLRRHLRHHDLVRLFPGHHDRLGAAGHLRQLERHLVRAGRGHGHDVPGRPAAGAQPPQPRRTRRFRHRRRLQRPPWPRTRRCP